MPHAHVTSLVHHAVKNTPSLPRISSQNIQKFCIDVALVALGFRTGYLLDLFTISEMTARNFGAILREEDSVFKDVLLVFHTDIEQVFFVNVSLLHDLHIEARSATPWTSFIYLGPDPQTAPNSPTEIHTVSKTLLNDWVDQLPALHTCITSLSSPQMIAFAGYLLEYPVSYYPVSSDQNSFLRDIPLEVYECILISNGFDLPRHPFMKFSRPAGCPNSSRTIVEMIERRFNRRLGQLHSEWGDVKIICDTTDRKLDRVAL